MPRTTHRYPTLDLLRLVAIALTLLTHARGLSERIVLLRPFYGGMWLGVDLFMLISGWLLGGQLLRDAVHGRFEPARFYVKRWIRTLPPYYVMLAALYFMGSLRVGGPNGYELELNLGHAPHFNADVSGREILTHLSFLQRYIPPNLYGVSWSLCVEEHFYLVLPIIVWILVRWPRFWVVASIVVGTELVAVICRTVGYTDVEWIPQTTHLRCHGLFVGLLLAWINIQRPLYWARLGSLATWMGAFGIAGTLIVMASVPDHPSRWTYVAVPTIGTWTLACLFLACVHEQSSFARVNFRGLQYLGELTYSVYLVHNVLPRAWLGEHSGEAGFRGVIIRVVLTMALSILLHHVVERPALSLRRRLLKRWRSTAVLA